MSKNVEEKRAVSKQRMMEIVENAYDKKMISKEHSHGEVVYKIRVPHEEIGMYSMVADHDA